MPTPSKQISIEIIGRGAICTALPEIALATMQYQEQSFHFRRGKGNWRESGFRLFDTTEHGETIVPMGSVPRLERELRRHGYEVQVQDHAQLPQAIRDFDRNFYEQVDPNQRQRCDQIINLRQFILAASRGARSQSMGLVTRLFPKAKILIVAPTANADECNRIMLDLEWAMGGNVDRARGWNLACPERVAIASARQFELSNPADWHIADSRNLRSATAYLAAKGEKSPGPDGVRIETLSEHESWLLCRELQRVIRSGTYRAGPSRRVWVPKSSGNGVRPIDIPGAADKIVQRAFVQAVQPFVDPTFSERSLGFRPGRGREHALVTAEHLARTTDAWTWIAEDLKDAFTQPSRERLYQALRQLELPEPMINLTRNALGEGQSGLPQGGPISAFLLNCFLDRYLDRPWERRFPDTPLIRVADDLLAPTRVEEARDLYEALADLTRSAGMPLKGTPSQVIVHLDRGEQAEWLGFRVGRSGDSLSCRIGTKAWTKLRTNLILDHLTAAPSNSAVETVLGWVDQLGPCLPWEDVCQVYARVISVAAELGFEETPKEAEFILHWQRAYARYTSLRAVLLRTTECFGGGSANRHCETAATSGCGLGVPVVGSSRPSFSSMPAISVYTDGCCLRPSGAGGWAFILNGPEQSRSEIRSGGEPRTTNNRMELAGVINGLERIGEPSRVQLFTDSKYVHDGITKYLAIWRTRRWRCLGGGQLANFDLWERLASLLEPHDVRCQWVRGHSGDAENELCDRAAREAAMQVLGA